VWPGLEGDRLKPRGFPRSAQSSPGHPIFYTTTNKGFYVIPPIKRPERAAGLSVNSAFISIAAETPSTSAKSADRFLPGPDQAATQGKQVRRLPESIRFDLVRRLKLSVELAGVGCDCRAISQDATSQTIQYQIKTGLESRSTAPKMDLISNVVQSLSHGCLSQDDRPRRWSAVLPMRT
jgi:hypothetical protein